MVESPIMNNELTAQYLLPSSLSARMRQLGNVLYDIRSGVDLHSYAAVEEMNRVIVELVFGHLSFPRDPRTMKVASFSIMLAHEHWLQDYGSKNVTRSVPSYLSHDRWWEVQEAVGDNLHVLLGSMTPYSTLGHQVMMTDLFGPRAHTIHLDIESVALTTLTEPSLQAD